MGGDNHFQYASNPVEWLDLLGLKALWNTRLMRGMLRNKSPLTIGDRIVYQDSKAFKFSNSNICKMLKGQSPRANDGDKIELHHITGKDPGALMEIGFGVHNKISKQLHFLLKKALGVIKSNHGLMINLEKNIGKKEQEIIWECHVVSIHTVDNI